MLISSSYLGCGKENAQAISGANNFVHLGKETKSELSWPRTKGKGTG